MTNRIIIFHNNLKKSLAIVIAISCIAVILPFSILTTYADSIDISKCTISGIKNMEHTGERVRLNITVKYGNKKLAHGKDYKLAYRNNLNPGMAEVKIQGIGAYHGEIVKNFEISPKQVAGVRVVVTSVETDGQLRLSWDKNENVNGYQIRCTDHKKSMTRTVKASDNYSIFSVSDLKKIATYREFTFKVRAYRIANGEKVFGAYSDSVVMYVGFSEKYTHFQKIYNPETDIDFGESVTLKYVKNQLLVTVEKEISFDKAKSIFDVYEADIIGYYEYISKSNRYRIEFREPKNYVQIQEVMREIEAETDVMRVSLDYIIEEYDE